jgi:hypothetical protein
MSFVRFCNSPLFLGFFFFFEIVLVAVILRRGLYIAQLALKSQSTCLSLLRAGIIDMHHHTQLSVDNLYFEFVLDSVMCFFVYPLGLTLDLWSQAHVWAKSVTKDTGPGVKSKASAKFIERKAELPHGRALGRSGAAQLESRSATGLCLAWVQLLHLETTFVIG